MTTYLIGWLIGREKGLILFHNDTLHTRDVLPDILEALAESGFVVTRFRSPHRRTIQNPF